MNVVHGNEMGIYGDEVDEDHIDEDDEENIYEDNAERRIMMKVAR